MRKAVSVPSRSLRSFFVAAAVALLSHPVLASEPWRTLETPVDTAAQPGQIEVAELFWYGCNHCDALEPYLSKWLAEEKPDNVSFVRIPAVFSDQWLPLARAYYSMQLLDLGQDAHEAMFDAIHRQRRNMNSMDELENFFANHGVDAEKFRDTYDSFAVDTMVRRAIRLTREYRITGVPALAVAGKFVTSSSQAGGHLQALEVVERLVAMERAARSGS